MNCSVCNTELQPDSEYCPKCGIDAWVDPALVKILEDNQAGTYGFEYPEEGVEPFVVPPPEKNRGWLRWLAIAVVTSLVTFGGISLYRSFSASIPTPSQTAVSLALPTFEMAFPAAQLSQELSPACHNLETAIASGISSEELQGRVNAVSTANQSVTKAKAFVAQNSWVANVQGPDAWLGTVSVAVSLKLSDLVAKSSDPAVKAATLPDLAAAYQSPLQSAWLAECGLSGDFAAKQANLVSYQQVTASLLARAAEPEPVPTKTPVADGNTGQTGGTVSATWPPSGLKKVAGFANFAYKPINDFCSVGKTCAKFKLSSKASCSGGGNIGITFVDASGKILDSYNGVITVAAGSTIIVEANTDSIGVTGWDISNISCR